MSDRVTLPLNAALTGPMRSRTLAVISVSESFSSDSQPGMQAFSTSASFSAANTFSRGASIRYSPLISISLLLLAFPPHSYGEVAPSYGVGGVMSGNGAAPHDPSVADYRATSPYEWGGRRPYHLLV